jgi:hypothetical protein
MPSLRCLELYGGGDPNILSTQTSLTSLVMVAFSVHIRHCTNLLYLSTPLRAISDYQYIPSSLTRLSLRLGDDATWSYNDDNFIGMINHLPNVSSLVLVIGEFATQFLAPGGALSLLSRWLSLTELSIGTATDKESVPLNGLVHQGSFDVCTQIRYCVSFCIQSSTL